MFNFERYNKTRALFGIYQHIYWIVNDMAVLEGFLEFFDYLTALDYVYIVPVSKVMTTKLKIKQNNHFRNFFII